MNHPHSDQCDVKVYERAPALSPCTHLVNAPVFPLDFDTVRSFPPAENIPGHLWWWTVRSSPAAS